MRIPNAARVLFLYFPQFEHDYRTLIDTDIISVVHGQLKWRCSKASLAQYFRYAWNNDGTLTDGKAHRMRWQEIERAFGIRAHLSQYVNIGGYDKHSRDYDDIMHILHNKIDE